MKPDHKSCPSSIMKDGAILVGIVNEDNEVDFISNPIKINAAFVRSAKEVDKAAEKRFRFSNKCVQSGCQQWTGSRCGVIDKALTTIEEKYWKENLPACSIRSTCRWFSQNGANACKVCPLVITDTMIE